MYPLFVALEAFTIFILEFKILATESPEVGFVVAPAVPATVSAKLPPSSATFNVTPCEIADNAFL